MRVAYVIHARIAFAACLLSAVRCRKASGGRPVAAVKVAVPKAPVVAPAPAPLPAPKKAAPASKSRPTVGVDVAAVKAVKAPPPKAAPVAAPKKPAPKVSF